ncbi:MAG: transcription repressor NadR [Clostridium perfringens]|nr:transcription repressor NadR [Clostridium perfringens]
MNSSERREKILSMIKGSKKPLSGSYIAKELHVSRQLIVGDVALLRASGSDIISTARGYIINDTKENNSFLLKTIACKHTKEAMNDELNTIVDEGATVIDVTIEHPVYGELTGDLHISSRRHASDFIRKLESKDSPMLSNLTHGIHLHTIKCDDEEMYNNVLKALQSKGYLL